MRSADGARRCVDARLPSVPDIHGGCMRGCSAAVVDATAAAAAHAAGTKRSIGRPTVDTRLDHPSVHRRSKPLDTDIAGLKIHR